LSIEAIISILAAFIAVMAGFVSVFFAKHLLSIKSENNHDYSRSLIEACLDPLVTISHTGQIMDVNDALINATGLSRDALVGTDFSLYFTDPERASKGYQKAIKEGFVRDYELELKHISGNITPVLYNASVYRNHIGQIQGVFAAARDITEVISLRTKLEKMALYDNLTGLANRALLEQKWTFFLAQAKRKQHKIALAFLDINDFKMINDTYGHSVGDDLLKWFSERLTESIRETDVVFRVGGDEFILLFYDASDNKDIYADKIRRSLSMPFQPNNQSNDEHNITTSIGISVYPDDGESLDQLMSFADSLMYEDKGAMRARS